MTGEVKDTGEVRDRAAREAAAKVAEYEHGWSADIEQEFAPKGLSEDEAISLLSVAVDFGVSQVANGNWGAHAIIRKSLFTS